MVVSLPTVFSGEDTVELEKVICLQEIMRSTCDRPLTTSTPGDDGSTHFAHQYYRLSPWVINDVVQVLARARPDQIQGRLIGSW